MLELESLDRRIEALVLLEASDDARSLVHAQMQLARELSSEFGVARAMFWRGEISRLEGDLDAAAQSFEMVYEDAQRLGTPVLGAEAVLRLTMIAGARGDMGAVEAFALTAAGVFAVYDAERLAELRRVQGLALLSGTKEDRARGLARLGEAVSLREQQQRRYGGTSELVSVALESHAQGLRAVGHPAEALVQLERALALHRREFGQSAPRTRLLLRQTFELLVELGRFADAELVVDSIFRHDVQQRDLVGFVADVEEMVRILILVGQPQYAARLYRDGLEIATTYGIADELDDLALEFEEPLGE